MAGLVDAMLEDLVRHVVSTIKSSVSRASASAATTGAGGGTGTSDVGSLPPLPPLPTTGGGGGRGGGPTVGQTIAGAVVGSAAATVGMRGGEIARNIAALPSVQRAVDFQLATSQSMAMGVSPTIAGVKALQKQMAAGGTALSPTDIAVAIQQASLLGMGGQNFKAYSASAQGISNIMPGMGVAQAGSAYASMQQAPNVNMLRAFGINMRNLSSGKAADINSVINQIWTMLTNLAGRTPTKDDIDSSLMSGGFLDRFIRTYGGNSDMQQALIQALYAKAGGAKDLSKKELKKLGFTTEAVTAQAERTETKLGVQQKTVDALVKGFEHGTKAMDKFTEYLGKAVGILYPFIYLKGLAGAAGTRAEGGPVGGKTSYIVGERGPELFVPSVDGYIIPNHDLPEEMQRITYREKGGPVKGSSTTKIGPIKRASGSDIKQWATMVLTQLGAPLSDQNYTALGMWAQREGGWKNNNAAYNPLNTTLKMEGSWRVPGNEPGVKGYPNLQTGVDATVKTLLQTKKRGYEDIVAALRKGDDATAILKAINASGWVHGSKPSNYDFKDVRPPYKTDSSGKVIIPPTPNSNPVVSAVKAVAKKLSGALSTTEKVLNPVASFLSSLLNPGASQDPSTTFSNAKPFQIYGGGLSAYISGIQARPGFQLQEAATEASKSLVRYKASGGPVEARRPAIAQPTVTITKPKETQPAAQPAQQTVNYGGVKIEIVVPAHFNEEKMVREIQKALKVDSITKRARSK